MTSYRFHASVRASLCRWRSAWSTAALALRTPTQIHDTELIQSGETELVDVSSSYDDKFVGLFSRKCMQR